jgi:predicted NUDIX family NTP pyrophosphohydrolase
VTEVPPTSAGLVLYRQRPHGPEVLLVHPGGPFWAHRDAGAWSIPKGEIDPGEDPRSAALRETTEELGYAPPDPRFQALVPIRQRGGKVVLAWAVEAEWDPSGLASNSFEVEWPRRSGRLQRFAEVDRAQWFDLVEARRRILPAQQPLLDQLAGILRPSRAPAPDQAP